MKIMIQDTSEYKGKERKKVSAYMTAILLLFYIAAKYLYKIEFILKELVEWKLFPIMIFSGDYFNIVPDEIATATSVLIYFIIGYEIASDILSIFYGSFSEKWWMRLFFSSNSVIFFLFLYYIPSLGIFHVIFLLVAFVITIKIMKNESDMVHFYGPVPNFIKFVGSLKGLKFDEMKKSLSPKIILCAFVCSCMLLNFISFMLGSLWCLFLKLDFVFIFLMVVWLTREYFSFSNIWGKNKKNSNIKKSNPVTEGDIALNLLFFYRDVKVKKPKEVGTLDFIKGIMTLVIIGIAFVSFMHIQFLISCISVIFSYFTKYQSLSSLLAMLTIFLLVFSLIFQFYFWYIVLKRFPYFIKFWPEADSNVSINAPRLPKGGYFSFVLNTFIIVFLSFFLMLWAFANVTKSGAVESLNYGEIIQTFTEGILFLVPIIIIIFFIEVYFAFAALNYRNMKELNSDNLRIDNLGIIVATTIQGLGFSLFTISMRCIFGNQDFLQNILSFLLIYFASTIAFYTPDLLYYLKKTSKFKLVTSNGLSIPLFVVSIFIAISGFAFKVVSGDSGIFILGIFSSFITGISIFVKDK
ncbi:TPA: hypothetical protein HA351_10090 [Methanosarcinaceae archaeon]|nr:hypothetical protein [Methanosarcinaceae archaeon]